MGTQYGRQTLEMRADGEGPVTATLVRRPAAPAPSGAAVLYVHGFVDYFFQTHLADFYVAQGYDFYALDLRKHGRSLAPHQTPNFCTDLADYYEELDEAVRVIREDGHDRLLVNGHSTGALLASLWAHDRRDTGVVDALFLNSAFLEFNEPWLVRRTATPVTLQVGKRKPKTKLPFGLNPVYGQSLHHTRGGSWDYNLDWKPLAGFPIYAGWVRAISAGQRRVHAGLDLRIPIFSAASAASYKSTKWSEAARSGDSILDVEHIAHYSTKLGRLVTIARIEGGLHDLALSAEPARKRLFDELERWLGAYLPAR